MILKDIQADIRCRNNTITVCDIDKATGKYHQPRHARSDGGGKIVPGSLSRPPLSTGQNWGHRNGGVLYYYTTGSNLSTSLSAVIDTGVNYCDNSCVRFADIFDNKYQAVYLISIKQFSN